MVLSHPLVMPAYKLLTRANDPGIFTSRLAQSGRVLPKALFSGVVSALVCGCLDKQPELFVSILLQIISQAITSPAKHCISCLGVGACRKLSVFIRYFLLHMHRKMGEFQRELKSYLVSNPLSQVGKLQWTSSSFKPCSEVVLLSLRMVHPNMHT